MSVDVQHIRRDNVLPAMIFEVVGHDELSLGGGGCARRRPEAYPGVNRDTI
jgi:hypothetical protein